MHLPYEYESLCGGNIDTLIQIDAGRKVLDKFRSCENEMCKSALEEIDQRDSKLTVSSLFECNGTVLLYSLHAWFVAVVPLHVVL